MQVVVLNGCRYALLGELVTDLGEACGETSQALDLLAREGQVPPEQLVVACRQRGEPQVRNAVIEMLLGMLGLAALELCVPRQRGEPGLRRVAELGDPLTGVGEQQPCPVD